MEVGPALCWGARQGKVRSASQGEKTLGEKEVDQWKWVQRHAGKDMENKIKEKLEKKRAKNKEEEK